MGIIKQTSDTNIIDNNQELITPLKVREVNDVIDAQVESVQNSITTINQNVSTLSSSSVPVGGLTGQVLAKRSNTDNDVEWIAPPTGGIHLPTGGTTGQVLAKRSDTDDDIEWITLSPSGDFLPLSGGTMTGDIDMQENNITNLGRIKESFYDAGSYSNRVIFFEPDAENDVFHVSTHLEYTSDQSSKFSTRSLVDKGYVDGEVQSYLPLSGGQMSSTAKIFKVGGLQIDFEQNTINSINTLRGNIFDLDMNAGYVDRAALQYRSDYSANYTARSLPDVEYVDARSIKVIKEIIETPSVGDTHTIFKQTDNFVVEVWQRQQNGSVGNFAGNGYYDITFEVKVGTLGSDIIVKFEDGVIDSNDQTRAETHILVYFYPDTVVTTYDRRV